jgi:hypothetical protein
VLNVAFPAEMVPVPIAARPSKNVTVPVGVPVVVLLTVAVNVTDWPKFEGLPELATVVVEASPLTVCDTAAEVLGSKVASP